MQILIEGLTSTLVSSHNGHLVVRFFANGLSRNRYIEVETRPGGAATLVYLEEGVMPQLEAGERLELLQQADRYLERLVRAMAYLHMNVEDAANGYTYLDAEFIKRGFEVRFALDGIPAWVKLTGVASIVISKVDEKGLPSPEDAELQGVFNGPFIGTSRVISMGVKALLEFFDQGVYASQIHPGVMTEFLLRENSQMEKLN